ncbi:ABZJ_00895 family protein [Mesobacterium pallidum]|uniref:ABZJ_00895 family protein n=1 Tax=Mesobacterium pallidum TaxID=2872037 RepID=UPI001EE1DCBF|nr:ABZJ_00895 family protein [Mesobacterium pallidum]
MQLNFVRYGLTYILAVAGLTLVSILMIRYLGIDFPSGAASVIPPMAAALLEGQRIGRSVTEMPANGVLWQAAGKATALVAVLNLVLLYAVSFLPGIGAVLAQIPPGLLTLIAAVLLVVVLWINWWFLRLGIKNELKAAKGRKG